MVMSFNAYISSNCISNNVSSNLESIYGTKMNKEHRNQILAGTIIISAIILFIISAFNGNAAKTLEKHNNISREIQQQILEYNIRKHSND
jgi:hypothetical protein